jgi:long-chain acyl-CoA synthetase
MTAHGLFTQNMTIVTAYETLGEEGLLHSMNETEVQAIFTSAELLPTVAKVTKQCPTLKIITYNGEAKPEHLEEFESLGIQVLSIQQVIALGKENPIEPREPEPEDLCCIMYTSGSTGAPKGVMLSHKNAVAAGMFYYIHITNSNNMCVCSCFGLWTHWKIRYSTRLYDMLLASRTRIRIRCRKF